MPAPKWPLLWWTGGRIAAYVLSIQSIVVSYALQHMVFAELACFVTCNQVPDKLFSVISQIALRALWNADPDLTPHAPVE
jgi:hypothetical protein